MCTFYFLGPVASALTNRYGCRVVTIAGAIVAAIGFILSLFAPNIYYLFFSFGILSGKLWKFLNFRQFATKRDMSAH